MWNMDCMVKPSKHDRERAVLMQTVQCVEGPLKSVFIIIRVLIPELNKEIFVETKGWASSFILELSSRCKDRKSNKNKVESPNRNLTFYKPAGLSAVNTRESMVETNKLNSDDYPVMLLKKEELIFPDTLRSINIDLLTNQSKKRMRVDSGMQSLIPIKRQKTKAHKEGEENLMTKNEEHSIADTNLLDSYLKYLS